jgi:excisionase family DNA binding protein
MSPELFSSYLIGKMLNVSRQAVNQWIDKNYMKSHRTPGGHRRVRREDLLAFLAQRGIPVPDQLRDEPTPAAQGAHPPRVVLLDDNGDFLTLIEQAATDAMPEAVVEKYTHPFDGLVAIGARPPWLLVLDLKMPQRNPLTREIPIVVVTAYDQDASLDRLRSLNVEQVISKTRPLSEIAEAIVQRLKALDKA